MSVLSFGFLSLAPLLGLGLSSARQARDHEVAAQIAETLADEAREGSLPSGGSSYDDQGGACANAGACYQATTSETALPGNCTRLIIRITPANSPHGGVVYAVVFPSL